MECRAPGPRPPGDLDFVAPDFDSIPASLARDFLFRHVHPSGPPGRMLLQFADPETALRVDVFGASGSDVSRASGTLGRASVVDFEFGPMPVVSGEDLLARLVRLLLDLAHGGAVPAKHAADYLRLADLVSPKAMEAAWSDHRKPSQPAGFHAASELVRSLILAHPECLIAPEYSRNAGESCARCRPIAGFPLADARTILGLWGYC
jgi:hypothetical protein